MIHKMINDLNEVLLRAANDLKFTSRVSPELIDSLLDLSNDYLPDQILILEDELKGDAQEFLLFSRENLRQYRNLEKLDKELQDEKVKCVSNKEFEKAANTRDKKRKIQENMRQEILKLNNFNEGFNAFKGRLLIVKPSELNKARVIEKFLEVKNKANN